MACLKHLKTFLQSKDLNYPELEDPDSLEKLHFMVDMTSHFNTVLQGQARTALQMLEDVLSFERKLTVFTREHALSLPLPESLQRSTQSHS